MSFPPPPENWQPDDEYGRAQINEFLIAMYSAHQREVAKVQELVDNAGIVRPSSHVGHPGYPAKTICIDAEEETPAFNDGSLTHIGRASSQSINSNANTPILWNTAFSDDDGSFVPNQSFITVAAPGIYTLTVHGQFQFHATGTRSLRIQVNGVDVCREGVQATAAGVTDVSCSTVVRLALNDVVRVNAWQTSGFSLALGGALVAELGFSIHRAGSAAPGGGVSTSQCYLSSFGGLPGTIQIPGDVFPVDGVFWLPYWGEDENGPQRSNTGVGDMTAVFGSSGIAGGPDPEHLSCVIVVTLPRGFTGWKTNAIVFRYGLHFEGVGVLESFGALTVTDVRNDNVTELKEGFSKFTHAPAGGVIDVPYGKELIVTKDLLAANTTGYREGSALRIAFSVLVPADHAAGATVTMGRLELNYA